MEGLEIVMMCTRLKNKTARAEAGGFDLTSLPARIPAAQEVLSKK
jgi:hypothetical protein